MSDFYFDIRIKRRFTEISVVAGMDIVSIDFAVLWIITAIVYFVFPLKHRWLVLLASSIFFYVKSGLIGTSVMLGACLVVWYVALKLDKKIEENKLYLSEHPDISKDEKKKLKAALQKDKRKVLSLGLVLCFACLFFFKYLNTLLGHTFDLLSFIGLDMNAPYINMYMPLGISFYTLQATSYIIDVYRGKVRAEKNPLKVALFVSFFPQMVQGPIGRFDHMAPQLFEGNRFNEKNFKYGLELMLWGLLKKLTLAEYAGVIANEVFNGYEKYSGFVILVGAIAYGLQVYADFSGGMDLIRGVAQVFGIEMAINFERPYFARSVSEFWRRWHITLGAWMRDYVFYPLSLSKKFAAMGKKTRKVFGNTVGKLLPTFLASFIAFMLVGIWHGSNMKYVAYGLWNSVIISGSILLEPLYRKVLAKLHIKEDNALWKLFQIFRTFMLVSIGRIFSRADNLTAALSMIKRMFTDFNPEVLVDGTLLELGLMLRAILILLFTAAILFVVSVLQERGVKIRETLEKGPLILQLLLISLAICFILVFGAYGSDFVYQQF